MAVFEFKTKVHIDEEGREWIQPPVLAARHIVPGSMSGREEMVVKLARLEVVLERLQTQALVFPGGTLTLSDFPALVAANSAPVRTFRVKLDLSLRRSAA